MSDLPRTVRRIPYVFYVLAVLFFAASWLLTLTEANSVMNYAESEDNPALRLIKLRGLYQAALEATYIAANGIMAHILLAIWKAVRVGVRPEMTHD